MATVHPADISADTVDIAGSAWPRYKLEALAAAAVICLILAVVTGSMQVAVLAAAGVAALRWVTGSARHRIERR
ncbi:hypothetical protein D5S18_31435 [Nocardia panacis]|uniref:Uncharacterized protein n=1 Tax=Nocardia panacis TaxID=2340916 RepID=A0A3A4K7M9_9NOCA|nr:hypothetical protein [Nocardia panacis]RJO69178.1 hypothetical protein D5S18_31435 [Nocardia panacis]